MCSGLSFLEFVEKYCEVGKFYTTTSLQQMYDSVVKHRELNFERVSIRGSLRQSASQLGLVCTNVRDYGVNKGLSGRKPLVYYYRGLALS